MIDLSWLPDNGGTGHMPPSKDVISFWENVKEETNFKHLVEIGFNAGHSSSIILSLFDDVTVSSYDIGLYDITFINAKIVESRFPDRFEFTCIDSKELTKEDISNCDILFIDGAHDYPEVRSDVNLFLTSDVQYAVIDDLQNANVSKVYTETSHMYDLMLEQTYEAILPYKLRGVAQPKRVPVRLVKKK